MLDAVIRNALRYRLVTIVLALVVLVYGGLTLWRLPIDVFPDLNRPRVTVMTEAPGLAPEEVETLVTFPLESVLNGATGVQTVRSASGVGLSVIQVEFAWGTDIYVDRQIVAEKIAVALDRLPKGVRPQLAPISSIMGQVMHVGMWSEGGATPPMEVRTLADWVVRQRLLTIPGVAQVVTMGGGRRQFQVLVNPESLVKYGLTLAEVERAVQASNSNATGGYLNQGGNELLVRALGRIQGVGDLESVVVKSSGDRPVVLSQVARVAEELRKWSELALVGGGPVDLLVWPESLAGTGWREEPDLQTAIQAVRRMGARALLAGSLDVRGPDTFNCAVLFQGPEGKFPQVYDKTHLVVMGEYVPLADFLPWLRKLVPPGGDLTAGTASGLLGLDPPGVRIAPLICFEDSVPRVVRRAAQKLPHLLVNLTNDAWFGASAGSRQHLENARLRAVETRLPLLRATNDGVTALINPRGVITAEVRDPVTGSIREPGFFRGELELAEPRATWYTRWGEWPVWISLACVGLGLWSRREAA
ncbi:MAG: apolipoprotein N-acyltransferase [Verrucomicrobia bacterium]|nr:apolipoprotein N-acyltransferase [Verrucomicrobiota bacterium]